MVPSHFWATGRPIRWPSTQKMAVAVSTSRSSSGIPSTTAKPGPWSRRCVTARMTAVSRGMENWSGRRSRMGSGLARIAPASASNSASVSLSSRTTTASASSSRADQVRPLATGTVKRALEGVEDPPRSITAGPSGDGLVGEDGANGKTWANKEYSRKKLQVEIDRFLKALATKD